MVVPGRRSGGLLRAAIRPSGASYPDMIRGHAVLREEARHHGVGLALWQESKEEYAMVFVKRLIQGWVIARVLRFLRRKM